MVKLNKIYTKTGDDGTTGLGDGSRRPKHDLRVACYGTVDEANASIGIARLYADATSDKILSRVQNDLFDLGADLCVPQPSPPSAQEKGEEGLRVTESQVAFLEKTIDDINANLPPLTSFILPAGNAYATHLHLARTIVRRAERMAVELSQSEQVNPQAVIYLNRLSDLLFVLARKAAGEAGEGEVLWQAGANR